MDGQRNLIHNIETYSFNWSFCSITWFYWIAKYNYRNNYNNLIIIICLKWNSRYFYNFILFARCAVNKIECYLWYRRDKLRFFSFDRATGGIINDNPPYRDCCTYVCLPYLPLLDFSNFSSISGLARVRLERFSGAKRRKKIEGILVKMSENDSYSGRDRRAASYRNAAALEIVRK